MDLNDFIKLSGKEKRPGLWANIHAKRQRGEAPAKPGSKDYPDPETFKDLSEQSKKEAKADFQFKSKHKSDKGGLTEAGRKAYNRATGSNLKRPQPEGGKRRNSFCARMGGMKKDHNISCKEDPDKRICKALRRWKCGSANNTQTLLQHATNMLTAGLVNHKETEALLFKKSASETGKEKRRRLIKNAFILNVSVEEEKILSGMNKSASGFLSSIKNKFDETVKNIAVDSSLNDLYQKSKNVLKDPYAQAGIALGLTGGALRAMRPRQENETKKRKALEVLGNALGIGGATYVGSKLLGEAINKFPGLTKKVDPFEKTLATATATGKGALSSIVNKGLTTTQLEANKDIESGISKLKEDYAKLKAELDATPDTAPEAAKLIDQAEQVQNQISELQSKIVAPASLTETLAKGSVTPSYTGAGGAALGLFKGPIDQMAEARLRQKVLNFASKLPLHDSPAVERALQSGALKPGDVQNLKTLLEEVNRNPTSFNLNRAASSLDELLKVDAGRIRPNIISSRLLGAMPPSEISKLEDLARSLEISSRVQNLKFYPSGVPLLKSAPVQGLRGWFDRNLIERLLRYKNVPGVSTTTGGIRFGQLPKAVAGFAAGNTLENLIRKYVVPGVQEGSQVNLTL